MGIVGARKVEKPWGHEQVFAETDRYVGKILFITAGDALSLQFHRFKDETIHLLEGELRFVSGPDPDSLESILMQPGDTFHVPPHTIHRMIAVTDCRVLEVSTPDLDDVVRLEDRYGRAGTSTP